jgi:hypothetical protein
MRNMTTTTSTNSLNNRGDDGKNNTIHLAVSLEDGDFNRLLRTQFRDFYMIKSMLSNTNLIRYWHS